jgi:hypothetical protein
MAVTIRPRISTARYEQGRGSLLTFRQAMRSQSKFHLGAKGLLLLTVSLCSAFAASVQRGEVVPMSQFEVKQARGYFDFDVRYDDTSDRVEEVKVTWVSPAAYKNALRVGDRLISIDGTAVTEFLLPTDLDCMRRDLKAGEVRTLVFTRTRLLRRLTVTHTTKGPDKSPGSTATSATSPAAAGPHPL